MRAYLSRTVSEGLLLSIGEKEGSSLDIYGPEGTDHFLASMRFHTRRCAHSCSLRSRAIGAS